MQSKSFSLVEMETHQRTTMDWFKWGVQSVVVSPCQTCRRLHSADLEWVVSKRKATHHRLSWAFRRMQLIPSTLEEPRLWKVALELYKAHVESNHLAHPQRNSTWRQILSGNICSPNINLWSCQLKEEPAESSYLWASNPKHGCHCVENEPTMNSSLRPKFSADKVILLFVDCT